MDAVLTTLAGAAPELGVGGILLLLLVYAQRSAAQDRADYRTALAEAARRHAEEIQRLNADHDSEIAELKDDIRELRKQVDDLQTLLDLEREARRRAEDAAARAQRRRHAS